MKKPLLYSYFQQTFLAKRLVYEAEVPPGKEGAPKTPSAFPAQPKENLDDFTNPENLKYADQFKKDFGDKIKDNKLIFENKQGDVNYRYTLILQPDGKNIKIEKLNLSEQKERREVQPLTTTITYLRLYNGVPGMQEITKLLEQQKSVPAPAPAPRVILPGEPLKPGEKPAETPVGKPTIILPEDQQPPQLPEKIDKPTNKEQAEKMMADKMNQVLAKYENMDPKTFTAGIKSWQQLREQAAKELATTADELRKNIDASISATAKVKGFVISTAEPPFYIIDAANMPETRATDWAYRLFLEKNEAARNPDAYKECSDVMTKISDYINGEGLKNIQAGVASGAVTNMDQLKLEINRMFMTFIRDKLTPDDAKKRKDNVTMYVSLKAVPVALIFNQDGSITWNYQGQERELAYSLLQGTKERNAPLGQVLRFDDRSTAIRMEQESRVKELAMSAWKESFQTFARNINGFRVGDEFLDQLAVYNQLRQNVYGALARYNIDPHILAGLAVTNNDYSVDVGPRRHFYHFNFDQNGQMNIDHTEQKLLDKKTYEQLLTQKMQVFFKKYQDMPPKLFMEKFKTPKDFATQYNNELWPILESSALAEKDQRIYLKMNGFFVEKTANTLNAGSESTDFYDQKKKAAEAPAQGK